MPQCAHRREVLPGQVRDGGRRGGGGRVGGGLRGNSCALIRSVGCGKASHSAPAVEGQSMLAALMSRGASSH
jgi:hypothetical protein